MATRPIVPRANGEGSLGVSTKSWGGVFANELNGANAVDMADFSKATLRQSSTAYVVGAMAYHATLPAGWYLECTTAGTTGSGALTITSPTVGGTVSDGTVTWTIRKGASTQDLTGYLPLSGGAMKIVKGLARINVDSNSGSLVLKGGTETYNGAAFALFGKDHSSYPGHFLIEAATATGDGNACDLYGMPDGTLTWGGHSLNKSAVVAESLGANGYRKYASGLIMQWMIVYISNGQTSVTKSWPIAFTTSQYVAFACDAVNADITYAVGSRNAADATFMTNVNTGVSFQVFAIGH